jgi:hypothetical protein
LIGAGLTIELEGSMINKMRESRQLKILQAYIDRRHRLWVQIRADYPAYTQAQVEARMEQFGV